MQNERASLAQVQEGFFVRLGDLVTWRPDLPLHFSRQYGIIVELVSEYLVGVLWFGYEHVYMEPTQYLEVVNEGR